MKQKVNYDAEMQKIIASFSGAPKPPKLLLHSCCGPCSTSVLLRLAPFFNITVFYCNPNIDSHDEYAKRAEEQKRIIKEYNRKAVSVLPIKIIEEAYKNEEFLRGTEGLETCAEGGLRCLRCYFLRLKKTANRAAELQFDFFSTTLSVSPLKKADKINKIGMSLSKKNCIWLPADFKKRNGYLESVRLSKKFGLYRQDYCGCIYSKNAQKEKNGTIKKT